MSTGRPLPVPSHLLRGSPSRGHRRCQAAPWLHRSHPRPLASGSPGRTLLVSPHGCCCAGTAASHSWCPCRDRGVRAGGHGEGWRRGEGGEAHSLLGASDIGAIGELPAVPTFIPSCVQGGHAGAGDRTGTCSGGRPSAPLPSPQHPSPAMLYLAPAAAGTAPHRWHRPRCSSVPAHQHRAARPAGTCQRGSAERPRHRTRAGRTRPALPDTCVQHGAAVGGHGQINRVSGVLAHHGEWLVCPWHGCPFSHTWQSWQQVSPVAHTAPGISWQELLLQQGSVHSCGGGAAVSMCHQHPALGTGNHPASPRHPWAEPWRKEVHSGLQAPPEPLVPR